MSERRNDVFEVVFVCTGNQARSPLAEALFRRYANRVHTMVASYGTQDVGAMPALPLAVEAARRLGIDLTAHRARAVRHARLESADLILGFEPFHVAAAVIDGRAPSSRTFLLGELVTLFDAPAFGGDPYERARTLLADADVRRVRSRPDPGAQVVEDPIGKPAEVMTRTGAEIDRLVRQLVSGLFGPLDDAVEKSNASSRRRWGKP